MPASDVTNVGGPEMVVPDKAQQERARRLKNLTDKIDIWKNILVSAYKEDGTLASKHCTEAIRASILTLYLQFELTWNFETKMTGISQQVRADLQRKIAEAERLQKPKQVKI